MNHETEKLLPIGSIVKLEGSEKNVMVIGVCPQTRNEDGTTVTSDYVGVMYPEGYISPDFFFTFNQDQIVSVEFEGYRNGNEWEEFTAMVGKIVSNTSKNSEE